MNVEHEDEEFVDVESRGSEHNKQSNDPPPEFTGTKPSELKSYRKKVASFHAHFSSVTRLRVLSRLTGPAWDACDGLEPEDVATADGVNMILDTLAEAFQGEHETELFLMLWRTLSMDLAGSQTGGAAVGPSTGFPSAASSEPEHPSTHCHHDSGRATACHLAM